MTLEAQRIAIAEACGWVRGKAGTFHHDYWTHPTASNAAHSFRADGFPLPDYLNDLNVIQSALFAQPEIVRAKITYNLGKIAEAYKVTFCECLPAWWAEAFLRTLNLWNDNL